MIGYDKRSIYYDILLDLPYREGTGTITKDIAKPHHPLTMNDPGGGSFTWDNMLLSGCPYLEFVTIGGGATDGVYLDCPAADTGDLDFTTEDYSVCGWINWDSTWGLSEMIIDRGGVDLDGWDLYLNISGGLNTLSQRHHHTPGRSECFSVGWTPGTWWFFSMSRVGIITQHYRNCVPLVMDYGGLTMLDPDTCNRDLVIGTRYTKDANWYIGMMWRPRVWARALSMWEWKLLFEMERHLFGV